MVRVINFCGLEMELADYEEKHRYTNQAEWIDQQNREIPFNPVLRPGFDCTPNHERDDNEVADWWGKPFICTDKWLDETYEDYCKRVNVKELRQSEAQFVAQKKIDRDRWYTAWPDGIRYSVRVLDGGAWDRSTNLGMVRTLGEAVAIAKRYLAAS